MRTITTLFISLILSATLFAQVGIHPQATASGTDTYTASISTVGFTYATGQRIMIKFTNHNTGVCTINITPPSGTPLGPKAIKKNGTEALAANDIKDSQILLLVYDGTNFQVVGGGGGGGVLYTSTGSNTDGSMDQNSTTIALATKQGTLTNSAGLRSALSDETGTGNAVFSDGATLTGTVVLPSTTSIGTVSSTEIGYVDGVTSAIQGQIDLKAPLASPTFTGTPTLPTGTVATTQSAGTNNTTVSTTAYSDAKVADVITNGVTGVAPSENAVYDALITKPTWYNVMAYGATGDGVTDDTNAFIAAIAAAPAGTTVYVPVGTYIITSALTITKTLNFLGEGGNTIIRTSSGTLGLLNFNNTAAPFLYAPTIRKLRFVNNSVANPTAGYAVRMAYVEGVIFDGVDFSGFYDNVIIENAFRVSMNNCSIVSYVRYGINRQNTDATYYDYGDDSYYNLTFTQHRVVSGGATSSFNQLNAAGTKMVNCKFNRGGQQAKNHYTMAVSSGAAVYDLEITGCSFENSVQSAIVITGAGGSYQDLVISGNQFNGVPSGSSMIALTSVNRVSVVGNTFFSQGGGTAITLTNVTDVNIDNQYDAAFVSGTTLATSGTNTNIQGWFGNTLRATNIVQSGVGYQPIALQSTLAGTGQMVANLNLSATFSGTALTTSGRQVSIFDSPNSKYRWGIDQNGDMWVGETSSIYGMRVTQAGQLYIAKTVTAAGTTGAQTINKTVGSVNFAGTAQTLVVTNSFVSSTSLIQLTVLTDDTTAKSAVVSSTGSGTFTIKLNAAATAETKVMFTVFN